MKKYDLIIVGGGPAGMTAAIMCARKGIKTVILDHKDKIGKKILSTGNGKCNITNLNMDDSCYRGNDSAFAYTVTKEYNSDKTLEFMDSLGVLTKDKNGYVYPNSEQASTVLDNFMLELNRLKVDIITEVNISKINVENTYKITTDKGTFSSKYLLLSTGGKAAPKTGSDGSGYELAKSLGHKIITPLPALTALKIKSPFFKIVAGVRCEAVIKVYVDNKEIASDRGELQFTDYGVSGIPTFQVSRYAIEAFNSNKEVIISIEFLPSMKEDNIIDYIKKIKNINPDKSLEQLYSGIMNKKLAQGLRKLCVKDNINEFTYLCKDCRFVMSGYNSFDNAQVCQGGVSTSELKMTMESKKHNNLYLAGELVDVDGKCGGYNLQWAFSSAMAAADDICKKTFITGEQI